MCQEATKADCGAPVVRTWCPGLCAPDSDPPNHPADPADSAPGLAIAYAKPKSRWLLTAAHCAYDSNSTHAIGITVRYKGQTFTGNISNKSSDGDGSSELGPLSLRYHEHNGYTDKPIENDIAMIELGSAVTVSETSHDRGAHRTIVSLIAPGHGAAARKRWTNVYGRGRTGEEGHADEGRAVLLHAQQPLRLLPTQRARGART